MKANPAYKGKWHAPRIDNPSYKGIWKPQQIPNPSYFELEKPDFEPIAAIGIEIWTMQDGILFDNILIVDDEKVAEAYREKTWKPKYELEKEKDKVQDASSGVSSFQKKIFDILYWIADIPFLGAYKSKIIDVIEKGEKQPNLTIGILVSVTVVLTSAISMLVFGQKKAAVTTASSKAASSSNDASTDEKGYNGGKQF
ncbi:hypothetical protein HPP92_025305 [Vanilla planifolia]|uniref:Calnexin-like protein n=1 Tax=Vanilla planifolia TaxID=51239 RepID=A0A835PI82_VANPL|nr:hypothetical protein HPP92_025305 [Vanilla planifolia]